MGLWHFYLLNCLCLNPQYFSLLPFNSVPIPLCRDWVPAVWGLVSSWTYAMRPVFHNHPSEWTWHPAFGTGLLQNPSLVVSSEGIGSLLYSLLLSKTSPCVSPHALHPLCWGVFASGISAMCHKDASIFICKLSSQMIFGSFLCWKKGPEREKKKKPGGWAHV